MANRDTADTNGLNLPPSDNFNKSFSYGFYLERTDERVTMDQLVNDPTRYIELKLNPQQISWREPIATKIRTTQGGGKVVESRGGVMKHGTISGTTGYLPTPEAVLLSPGGAAVKPSGTQGARSGFAEFYQLRRLFRIFMNERRAGNTNIFMHYMDFKGDEFWLIEPSDFQMPRTSKRPFLYNYTIIFDALEPSTSPKSPAAPDLSDPQSVLSPDFASPAALPKVRRQAINGALGTRLLDMASIAAQWVKNTVGAVKLQFQGLVNQINEAIGIINTLRGIPDPLLDTASTAFGQLADSIQGTFDAVAQFSPTSGYGPVSGLYTSDTVMMEMNGFLLEMRRISDQLQDNFNATFGLTVGSKFTEAQDRYTTIAGMFGSAFDTTSEPANSSGPMTVNPMLGRNGLALVSDLQTLQNLTATSPEIIPDGADIYSLAQQFLGSSMRFMELVILNSLEAPYIFDDPSNKPPNTLAWGEIIQVPSIEPSARTSSVDGGPTDPAPGTVSSTLDAVDGLTVTDSIQNFWPGQLVGMTLTMTSGPAAEADDAVRVVVDNDETTITLNRAWTTPPVVGDSYEVALDQFSLRQPVTPEVEAYGRDLLAVPQVLNSGSVVYDLAINALGDLAVVEGKECLFQGLAILLSMERYSHPVHKTAGVPQMVGRPLTGSRARLYGFYARQALLSDPRVSSVLNPQYLVTGDVARFQADVLPVRTKNTKFFSQPVG